MVDQPLKNERTVALSRLNCYLEMAMGRVRGGLSYTRIYIYFLKSPLQNKLFFVIKKFDRLYIGQNL